MENQHTDFCTENGWTPLMSAAAAGRTQIVSMLIEKYHGKLCDNKTAFTYAQKLMTPDMFQVFKNYHDEFANTTDYQFKQLESMFPEASEVEAYVK